MVDTVLEVGLLSWCEAEVERGGDAREAGRVALRVRLLVPTTLHLKQGGDKETANKKTLLVHLKPQIWYLS